MDHEVGDVLRGIVWVRGKGLIDDPRRLGAILKDLAGNHPGRALYY